MRLFRSRVKQTRCVCKGLLEQANNRLGAQSSKNQVAAGVYVSMGRVFDTKFLLPGFSLPNYRPDNVTYQTYTGKFRLHNVP